MQPPPAIKPCNLEACEDKLRLSELSLGEAKGPRLVCGSQKCASLGWQFGSPCSVGGLWLSWISIFVSSCFLVVGVCSVVAVSPTLVSSFTVIGGGNNDLKESIRRGAFFSESPATADLPANDIFLLFVGLSTGLHCFIVTTCFGSNEAPGLYCRHFHT